MNVIATANRDRYTKCRSCKATADFLLTNPEAVITKIHPGAEPTSQWIDGQQVFRDEVTVTQATISTCKRHAKLNTARAEAAQSTTLVFDGQRWSEQ